MCVNDKVSWAHCYLSFTSVFSHSCSSQINREAGGKKPSVSKRLLKIVAVLPEMPFKEKISLISTGVWCVPSNCPGTYDTEHTVPIIRLKYKQVT